jgi:transcriptional regulator with XRE-family HTH domain
MNRLKELRDEHKWLQKDVAKIAGVKLGTYSKWEQGSLDLSNARGYNLEKLADAFEVSIDYLMGRSNVR